MYAFAGWGVNQRPFFFCGKDPLPIFLCGILHKHCPLRRLVDKHCRLLDKLWLCRLLDNTISYQALSVITAHFVMKAAPVFAPRMPPGPCSVAAVKPTLPRKSLGLLEGLAKNGLMHVKS